MSDSEWHRWVFQLGLIDSARKERSFGEVSEARMESLAGRRLGFPSQATIGRGDRWRITEAILIDPRQIIEGWQRFDEGEPFPALSERAGDRLRCHPGIAAVSLSS